MDLARYFVFFVSFRPVSITVSTLLFSSTSNPFLLRWAMYKHIDIIRQRSTAFLYITHICCSLIPVQSVVASQWPNGLSALAKSDRVRHPMGAHLWPSECVRLWWASANTCVSRHPCASVKHSGGPVFHTYCCCERERNRPNESVNDLYMKRPSPSQTLISNFQSILIFSRSRKSLKTI